MTWWQREGDLAGSLGSTLLLDQSAELLETFTFQLRAVTQYAREIVGLALFLTTTNIITLIETSKYADSLRPAKDGGLTAADLNPVSDGRNDCSLSKNSLFIQLSFCSVLPFVQPLAPLFEHLSNI